MTQPTYEIRATFIDQADQSDPLNRTAVFGLKVVETTAVGRETIIEGEGDETTIRQVRADGLKDLNWGCKIVIERPTMSTSSAEVIGELLSALASRLLSDPPPPHVLEAIQAARPRTGRRARWTPWFDLTSGSWPAEVELP